MAGYTLAAGELGAYEKTLVAATVDTVTMSGDVPQVEVINEGTVGIYVRVDGTAPTVGSAASIYVPPNTARTISSAGLGTTVVKLISSGTPKYSVAETV